MTAPKHPRREDPVEKGLNERRTEKARPLLALEAHPKAVFEGRAHSRERRRVASALNPGKAVARVRCEKPSQVLRLRNLRLVRERPAKVLAKAKAHLTGEDMRAIEPTREPGIVGRKAEPLQRRLGTGSVRTDEHELAQIRHEHETIAAPVPAHLAAYPGRRDVLVRALHLDHATLRSLALARAPALHLPRRVETEIRMPRALVGQLADAEHLRLQRRPHTVQKTRKRAIARPLRRSAARGAHARQIDEVRLDHLRQLHIRSRHRPSTRRASAPIDSPSSTAGTIQRRTQAGTHRQSRMPRLAPGRRLRSGRSRARRRCRAGCRLAPNRGARRVMSCSAPQSARSRTPQALPLSGFPPPPLPSIHVPSWRVRARIVRISSATSRRLRNASPLYRPSGSASVSIHRSFGGQSSISSGCHLQGSSLVGACGQVNSGKREPASAHRARRRAFLSRPSRGS